MPTIQIRTTTQTRRQSVALMASLIAADPQATVIGLIEAVLGDLADLRGLARPTAADGLKRGRPVTTPPIEALCRPCLSLWVPARIADLGAAICADLGWTWDQVWSVGVERMWGDVCGPDAEIWERTRRAEAAGCAAAA
jgi:hypothetical protein